MNKISLIISREFFSRVKKKSFLITTLVVPIVIIAFYAAIIAISLEGSTEKKQIAVLDEAHFFDAIPDSAKHSFQFTFIKGTTEAAFVNRYEKEGYDAFLYLPVTDSGNANKKYALHSPASVSMNTMEELEDIINQTIRDRELRAKGIDPKAFEKLSDGIELENTIDTEQGAKKNFAGVAYGVSFACGMLIYMMMIIYGTQVMRGVTEEKTNRIAEVVISSVKPFQLMMGKIIGIGAVGLTQFLIWILLMLMMQSALPLLFPQLLQDIQNTASQNNEQVSMAADIFQGMASLPLAKILFSFLFYFLGGYLTYASIFAAVGSVVSEDQSEAQQLVFPILMPIILGFVLMTKAVNDPNSNEAIFGSIFPLTSPIVMMGRITYDVPVWQMALSMVLLILCFLFFTWITAKIYRTGILMYGKKPSWKEMIKWAFRRSG